MNLPSQVMGVEAVKDDAYFKATTQKSQLPRKLTSLGFISRIRKQTLYLLLWEFAAEGLVPGSP